MISNKQTYTSAKLSKPKDSFWLQFMCGTKKRLVSTAGFTLAEQLISIIFIGLLCVLISTGIGAAMAIHGNVSQEAEANQLLTRTMQEVSDELTYSVSVQSDNQTFESSTTLTPVKFINTSDGIALQEVGTGAATHLIIPGANSLVPQFETLPSYRSSDNTWVYNIVIKKGDETLASQDMVIARSSGTAS